MISVDAIRTRYPALIDYDDPDAVGLLMRQIEDAEADLDEATWGSLHERGVAALAAHRMTLVQRASAGNGAQAFPVSQSSADGVSAQYAVPTDLPPHLARYYTTEPGAQYMEWAKQIGGGPRLVS